MGYKRAVYDAEYTDLYIRQSSMIAYVRFGGPCVYTYICARVDPTLGIFDGSFGSVLGIRIYV
jgi:hypothetical protein